MNTETHIFDKEKLEKAAYILKTIGHPVRLAIIQLLGKDKSLSVNEICEAIQCEQSLVSHHLINMKLKGILQSQKTGQNVIYFLKEKEILKIMGCIENCDCTM
jgi:predicted transcriptional regulator